MGTIRMILDSASGGRGEGGEGGGGGGSDPAGAMGGSAGGCHEPSSWNCTCISLASALQRVSADKMYTESQKSLWILAANASAESRDANRGGDGGGEGLGGLGGSGGGGFGGGLGGGVGDEKRDR